MPRTVETDRAVLDPARASDIYRILDRESITLVAPDDFHTCGVQIRAYRTAVWVSVNHRTADRDTLAIRITRILARHNYAMQRSGACVRVDGKHTN